jgi:hypothetical protein
MAKLANPKLSERVHPGRSIDMLAAFKESAGKVLPFRRLSSTVDEYEDDGD